MKRTLTVLIGIAAGAAITAAISSTKRGKEVRTNLVKKANELRHNLASNMEERVKKATESEYNYI